MKTKHLILAILSVAPVCANAAIPYRVEQLSLPTPEKNETFSSEHRFYIGGMYNLALWQNYTDDNNVEISGKHSQSYEILAGLRVSDTFRLELDYTHTKAIWNQMSFDGETFLLNAIIDARIDSIYRILRNQMIMPYVGIGAGASWNTGKNTTNIDNKVSPVVAAMAGISIEFNPHFALDFGYRYLYMFNQKNNIVDDLNATAHQFRVGARAGF